MLVTCTDQLGLKEHYRAALAADEGNIDLLREFAAILDQPGALLRAGVSYTFASAYSVSVYSLRLIA